MSELFAVPLPRSRCLCPSPAPEPARFQKGARVAFADGEEGFVSEVNEHAVCIFWEESQSAWYPIFGGAVERITILDREDA